MFTVPYDTMALIHAKRVVADSTILFAVNLLMAEYDVSDAIRRQLSVCEEAKFEVTTLNQELVKKEAMRRGEAENAEEAVNRLHVDVARLRPWATIGKITVYGTVATIALIGANEAFQFIPELNLIP